MECLNPVAFQEDTIACHPLFEPHSVDEEAPVKLVEQSAADNMINLKWPELLDDELQTDIRRKIELPSFPVDRPWLPKKALRLIDKLNQGPISENEAITLMEIVSERATAHFGLPLGKFVALTFNGKVAEVADTRTELLKKLQSQKNPNSVFLWRIGFPAFSGRL